MTYIPSNPENYIQIGGFYLLKTGLIELTACRNNAGNNATFRRASDTAGNGYAPSAITYVPSIVVFKSNVADATTIGHSVGYADNDVGFRSSTAFTNGVFYGGGSTANNVGYTNANGESILAIIGWTVPAGKFPMYTSSVNGNSTATFYGYQV